MDAQQPRPSTAAREGAWVTVILETDSTVYKVYKALLVEHSEYFKKALTGPWKEAEDRVVRLEDVESHTFDVFVEMAHVQAYVFGDRFQALGFKDAVHRSEFHWIVAPYEIIIYAYNNLPEDDALLQEMADTQCSSWTPYMDREKEIEDRKKLPIDFLIRVMIRFGGLASRGIF
ncbi:hypothetical protein N0V95_002000 [Ascochyta clinopodiicola]|nr:hypothetical protein N0V95_002000 [Ascochyta clinopodiicola]